MPSWRSGRKQRLTLSPEPRLPLCAGLIVNDAFSTGENRERVCRGVAPPYERGYFALHLLDCLFNRDCSHTPPCPNACT